MKQPMSKRISQPKPVVAVGVEKEMSLSEFVAKYGPKKITVEQIREAVNRSLTSDAIRTLSIDSAYQYLEEETGHPLNWEEPTWLTKWEVDGDFLPGADPVPVEILMYLPIERTAKGDSLRRSIILSFEAWTDEGEGGERAGLIYGGSIVLPLGKPAEENGDMTWEDSELQVNNSITIATELDRLLTKVALHHKKQSLALIGE